jgi:hypothetical protein
VAVLASAPARAQPGLTIASADSGSGRIIEDGLNRRIYVMDSAGRLRAFDEQLRTIGQLALRTGCGVPAAFSPHTGRLYVVESEGRGLQKEGVTYSYYLGVFDAATGRRLDSRDVTRAAGLPTLPNNCGPGPIAVITAPGAPQGLTAAVTGRNLSLAWTNVGDASSFVLDVGLAPGRTDLTFSIGATSPVTISNAPPGTYYLRVRGTNAFGVSRPSNEAAVVVP